MYWKTRPEQEKSGQFWDAHGVIVAIKWRNGILHKMNANAMKTRLDQTKTRQPDTEGGTVVTRICMTAILSNKVFGLDRQLSLYIECHHHEQVQRIVAHMKKRPDQDQTDRQGAEGDIVVTHLAPTASHYFTV